MRTLSCVLAVAFLVAGCATHGGPEPRQIAETIRARTGATPRIESPETTPLPAGITIDDGLSQDEAVAIALWNNADFQVAVSDLGFARVDLLEAGLLSNPVFSLLFPVGPKQLESTLKFPIELLWERPRRIAAARVAADAAAQRLIQAGLDLAAFTKDAHGDVALAQDRQQLAGDAVALLQRIDELTQTRLAAGDIGELEARAARVDAARAQQDLARMRHDVTIATERLRARMGLAGDALLPVLRITTADATSCRPSASLLRDALTARPDVRAAELSLEAAAARLGWERSRVLAITAVIDANGSGSEGFEIGPGIELGLPVFNRNQAGKSRAAAEMQRATASYAASRQRVALEVLEASAQLAQAAESQSAWHASIVEPLEANVAAAERSFANGDTSFLFVLENSRRLLEARMREREIDADLRRARTRLERAIGQKCGA